MARRLRPPRRPTPPPASALRKWTATPPARRGKRFLRDLDIVKREDFEAVKEMARIAREDNEALKARVAALEARLSQLTPVTGPAAEPEYRSARSLALQTRSSHTSLKAELPNAVRRPG
jgi:hypothetical protein